MKRMKTWEGWCVVRPDGTLELYRVDRRGPALAMRLRGERIARVRVTEVVKPKRRKPR